MSLISFHCPGCHAILKTTNPELTGRTIRCPRCGHAFAMPTEAEREALTAALQPAPPTAPVAEGEGEAAGEAKSSPTRRRRVLVAYLVCGLLVMASTGVGAFMVWDRVAHGTRNTGTGEENALAYIPGDSNIVLRIEAEHWSNQPELRLQMEHYVRSLGNSPFFLDWRRSIGLEFTDLFHELTYALRLPSANGALARRPLATTLIVRSRVPFQQRKIARAFPNAIAEKIHGQTVYRINEPMFQTLYMPSDRTIVLTNVSPVQLTTLLEVDGSESRLPPDLVSFVERVEKQPFWVAMGFDGSMLPEMNKSVESLRSVAPAEWHPLLEALPAARSVGLWSEQDDKNNVRVRAGLVCANDKVAANVAEAFGELVKSSPLRKAGYTAILSRTSFPVSFRQLGSAFVQDGQYWNNQEVATAGAVIDVRTFRLVLRDLHRNLGLRRPEMLPSTGPMLPFPPEDLMPQDGDR
jgi:hypothetical protein